VSSEQFEEIVVLTEWQTISYCIINMKKILHMLYTAHIRYLGYKMTPTPNCYCGGNFYGILASECQWRSLLHVTLY
jgi:hypothetical protein